MDPLSVAASGIRSAEVRIAKSAHNVANLTTESFHPLRVHQSALAGGGSVASTTRAQLPEDVDLAREFVDQMRASLQFRGSLRILDVAAEMRGNLLDLLA